LHTSLAHRTGRKKTQSDDKTPKEDFDFTKTPEVSIYIFFSVLTNQVVSSRKRKPENGPNEREDTKKPKIKKEEVEDNELILEFPDDDDVDLVVETDEEYNKRTQEEERYCLQENRSNRVGSERSRRDKRC
jgi:hypothetical protein